MERRTLLAIILVLLVLAANQVLFNQYTRAKRKHAPPVPTEPTPGALPTGPDSGAPAPGGPGIRTPGRAETGGFAPQAERTADAERGVGARPGVPVAPRLERTLRGEGFEVTFASDGGSISHWVLTRYRDPVRRRNRVDLVPDGVRTVQVRVRTGFGEFDFAEAPFRLTGDDSAAGSIRFEAVDSSGLRVEKSYRLSPDRRLLDLQLTVSAPPELGALSYRLGWGAPLPITEASAHIQDHQGVAYLGQKLVTAPTLPRGKEKSDQRVESGNVRWVGQRTRYFIAAVVPDSESVGEALLQYGRWSPPPLPEVRLPSNDLVAATAWLSGGAPPGTEIIRRARLYAGPIQYERLQAVGAGLEVAVNLGWKWLVPLSVLLLKLLNILHRIIPNYGIAIVLLSAATKLVFYPLTQSSLRTMKVMHRLQPQVE
ncbi:MAG TPA: membrane protein insertase YidC, partial [Candidatus Eisenbacteria bacterium]